MSVRELVILGTAAQVPTRERNHNGYLLRWDNDGFLFDPGEGTQRQMQFADVAASTIHHIALTHFHGDHCLGVPGVIQRLNLDKVTHPIHAHYPASGEPFFDALCRASLYQNTLRLTKHPISATGYTYESRTFHLMAESLDHRTECYGYRVQELPSRTICMEKLDALGIHGPDIGKLKRQGFLQIDDRQIFLESVSYERPTQSFAIVMDTRPCEGAQKLAQNVDVLLCEATYTHEDIKLAHEYMHMTAVQAAELARDAKAKKLVLTHFSQRYRHYGEHLQEARAIFPNTILARDGDRIAFPTRQRQV